MLDHIKSIPFRVTEVKLKSPGNTGYFQLRRTPAMAHFQTARDAEIEPRA